MGAGDHIKVFRFTYWHHGINLGNGQVAQYSGEPIPTPECRIGAVSMEEFARGGRIDVVDHPECYSSDVVIGRARSRLGEQSYSVPFNNCEHFARWCKVGEERSGQVQFWTGAFAGAVAWTAARAILGRAAAGYLIPVGGPIVGGLLTAYGIYKLVRLARRGSGRTGPIRLEAVT